MRSVNDGVALAALVAKETLEGKFVGSILGSKRAKELAALPKAKFRWAYVMAPLIGSEVIAISIPLVLGFLKWTRLDAIGNLFSVIFVVGGALWCLFFNRKREKEERDRFAAAKAQDAIFEKIYDRLRYVEADHIVFDPKTMKEVPANREALRDIRWSCGSRAKLLRLNGKTLK